MGRFNDFLIAYSRLKPRFHYADLDYFAKRQPDMIADWGRKQPDELNPGVTPDHFNVHQMTQQTSVALANFAILSVAQPPATYNPSPDALWPTGGCGMPRG